jgi:hypothetical protein
MSPQWSASLNCEVFGEGETRAYLVQFVYKARQETDVCRRSESRLIIFDEWVSVRRALC